MGNPLFYGKIIEVYVVTWGKLFSFMEDSTSEDSSKWFSIYGHYGAL